MVFLLKGLILVVFILEGLTLVVYLPILPFQSDLNGLPFQILPFWPYPSNLSLVACSSESCPSELTLKICHSKSYLFDLTLPTWLQWSNLSSLPFSTLSALTLARPSSLKSSFCEVFLFECLIFVFFFWNI